MLGVRERMMVPGDGGIELCCGLGDGQIQEGWREERRHAEFEREREVANRASAMAKSDEACKKHQDRDCISEAREKTGYPATRHSCGSRGRRIP